MSQNKILDYKNLLAMALDAEGLIRVAMARAENGDSTAEVEGMLGEKISAINAALVTTDNEIAENAEFEETADADITATTISKTVKPAVESAAEPIAGFDTRETANPEPYSAEQEPSATTATAAATATTAQTANGSHKKIAMTIGDRYRFTKELFDGKEDELKETLADISTMSTIDEVHDYLYNDLCFDEFNPAVKDFVAVIAKTFNAELW